MSGAGQGVIHVGTIRNWARKHRWAAKWPYIWTRYAQRKERHAKRFNQNGEEGSGSVGQSPGMGSSSSPGYSAPGASIGVGGTDLSPSYR